MIVYDNFVQDNALWVALKDKKLWQSMPDYNWWDGWWETPPSNALERMIQIIWKNEHLENKIAGFEYWYNISSVKANLKWHRDCDDKIRVTEKRQVSPIMGHIFYILVDALDGGFLEITDRSELRDIEFGDLERIKPVENRLIVFDPSCWHRVTRVTKGFRISFSSSVWGKKPRTFDEGNHVTMQFEPVNWEFYSGKGDNLK